VEARGGIFCGGENCRSASSEGGFVRRTEDSIYQLVPVLDLTFGAGAAKPQKRPDSQQSRLQARGGLSSKQLAGCNIIEYSTQPPVYERTQRCIHTLVAVFVTIG